MTKEDLLNALQENPSLLTEVLIFSNSFKVTEEITKFSSSNKLSTFLKRLQVS